MKGEEESLFTLFFRSKIMTDKEKSSFKTELKDFAMAIIEERLRFAQEAMKRAQEAANEEGKSSVGDKYEVSRAMGQIDSEMNARQLEEANRDLVHLQNINVAPLYNHVNEGTFVITDAQKFFFGIGLGIHKIHGDPIVFISINSPLGKACDGKKPGAKVNFNGKAYLIKEIW